MEMKPIWLAVVFFTLSPVLWGQTTVTQTYAAISFNPGLVGTSDVQSNPAGVVVERDLNFCDLTCTTISYTFCGDETPGCLEGFMEVPNSAFTGNITLSYTAANTLKVNSSITSGTAYGTSYYCYAWDSAASCTDEVDLVAQGCTAASCPIQVGTIVMIFTKTPLYYDEQTNTQKTLLNGVTQQTINYSYLFSDEASATNIVGANFTLADDDANPGAEVPTSCCMAVNETYVKTTAAAAAAALRPASEVFAGQLSEKVLRRFKAVERIRQAAIASRTGRAPGLK
jgi:hypothetical protein